MNELVLSAFRKLMREAYFECGQTTMGMNKFTIDGTTYGLNEEEIAAVNEWFTEITEES